jgi:hypothetical protein
MNYEAFLERLVNDGVAEVSQVYKSEDKKRQREGALAGFEACRGKKIMEFPALLAEAKYKSGSAYNEKDEGNYWYWRYYELQVEWVCNCLSAVLQNEKLPTIVPPTVRACMKAAEIVGVRPEA